MSSSHMYLNTNESIVPIHSTEELEKRWDRFSSVYSKYNNTLCLSFCNILIANLVLAPLDSKKIPKSILEVGCGAGAGTELCIFYKHPSTKLTSTDLSGEMIQLTKKRCQIPLELDCNTEKSVSIQKADAENLPFGNATFDRYLANLCLHLVNDPDQMFSESYRVLEDGGIAAFSVWGRKENTSKFTIVNECAEILGITSKPMQRSAFHLNDLSKLREMGLKAGFKKVLTGYTYCNDLSQSGEEFVESVFSTPELVDKAKVLDEQLMSKWRSLVKEHVDNLYNQGKFIGFEAGYMICTK
ncbi:hypothetical protein DLAC_11658 [Tieghemostelium lacteum]|uniref:Methyltransferase type 11 domain-containing protein n=1 Tax=Tieghemostelium lacteum TaxID=361077 RepID=A0A151ZF26_TIELA|nr:hypothetical protein DLAC_11658 [Tieghemostelium lacteum]|eukprot:KYQ92566.1 hypothetical protein DLAC_11658 [Tieghemostelium lacteum]